MVCEREEAVERMRKDLVRIRGRKGWYMRRKGQGRVRGKERSMEGR